MNKLLFKNIFSVVDDYDVFLFDLWGVIVEGEEIYPGVVETINEIITRKKVFFVTNSPRPTSAALLRIQSWNINVTTEMVITSGEVARELINNSEATLGITRPKVYHLGEDRNDEIMRGLDCEIVHKVDEADMMVLSLARNEGEDLTEFDHLLEHAAASKILVICANPDTIISKGNSQIYCPGFFAAKIERKGGKVIYTGKPETAIYEKVLKQLPNISRDRILMIGDTFDTDILGAENVGIHSALVLTGNAKKFHVQHTELEYKLAALRDAAIKHNVMPNFIIEIRLENVS